jgi:ketosteroid isomerase-like protein
MLPIVFLLAAAALAQDREQELMTAEQARLQARTATDSAAAAQLMSSDFLQVDRLGHLLTKNDVLKNYGAGITAIRETAVHLFGDTAVVTGIGRAPQRELRFLHLWHRENGHWVATFVQNTIIDPSGNASATFASGWPDGATRDERDIVSVQRAIARAIVKRDAAGYARLTTDDFLTVDLRGGAASGADLPAVASSPSKVSECRVRVDSTVAILSCSDNAPSRVTTVFIKQDGGWKQLVAQATPISAKK